MTVLDVFPCLSVDHIIDRIDRDAKRRGQSVAAFPCCTSAPHLQHRRLAQFGEPITLAAGEITAAVHAVSGAAGMSPLGDHISVVIGNGPEEQMIGPNARTIVAAVENVHTRGDGAEVQAPRDAVHPITVEGAVITTDLDVPVASALPDPRGLPAPIGFDDSAPETSLEVLLSEAACGIMQMHQITPGVVPSAVDAARGFLVEIIP